jgi:hypothetical protein
MQCASLKKLYSAQAQRPPADRGFPICMGIAVRAHSTPERWAISGGGGGGKGVNEGREKSDVCTWYYVIILESRNPKATDLFPPRNVLDGAFELPVSRST